MKQGMIVVIFFILWVRTETYDVRCPGPSKWNCRATVNCNSDKHYVCLYNDIDHVYVESCIPEEYLARIGKKKVRSPGLNEDDCSPDGYQPFIFTTRGNSDCVFVKSFCNEEGQVPANNGNTTTDRGCRCDYTTGYTYVTIPRDVCSCLPSEEDCHCYLKHCPVGHKLTADYTCTDHLVLQTCPEIRKSTVTVTQKSPNANDTDNISETVTYARNAAFDVLIITVIYIVLLLMLFINVQPYIVTVKYRDSLIVEICDEPFTYTVMPGDVLTIEWKVKSLFPIKSVVCEKNWKGIKSVVYEMKWKEIKSVAKLVDDKYTMKWSDDLMVLSLKIKKIEVEDAGMYTCKVTNVVHLTNTCADSFLNVPPCKRITVGVRKCMQYFPMIRLDVKNQVELCVDNIPTENCVVIKDSMAKLEVLSMKNITSVKWFRCHNKHFTSISVANKYNGGSTTTPSLSINTTTMHDAGIYVCLIKLGKNDKSAFRYSLKVIPEEKIYHEILNHRQDSCFVKTSTVHKAFRSLCDHGLVIISGREGTGKSKMCLELASMCEEKDFLPLVLDIHKCDQADLVVTKMLYIIDNIRFDKTSCDQLHKILPLLPCTEQRWIVITCRTSELLGLEDALRKTNTFKSECLIDLDNSLLEEEKLKIITSYLEKNNFSNNEVLSNRDSERKIIRSEPYYGFPLTAVQFCGDRKILLLGAKYFTDPPKSVVDKIKELYDHGQKDKNELCINQFCVLVLIAMNGYIDDSMDINLINKITKELFNPQIQVTSHDLIEAANSMVGVYVTYTGKHYIYVHPSLSRAMLLSSKYCANYLILHGSIQDIEDCVRSCNYEPVEYELVITLESNHEWTYQLLCERLIFEAHKDKHLAKEIFCYLYTNFIKLRDTTFVDVLFKHLILLHFQDQKFREPHTQDLPYNVTEYISTWEIITLLDGLTYNGTDPWIYYSKILPHFIIQCGLISACKAQYLKYVASEGTLKTLLTIMKENMQKESFFESIDTKGNTFFHYITLYGEAESCDILNALNILLLKDVNKKIGRPNRMVVTPLQIAAYLGKLEICRNLLVKTTVNKETLLPFVREGMNNHFESKSSSEFNIQDNFESDVLSSLSFETKQNYLALLELFSS